jgi:hypothetical protein
MAVYSSAQMVPIVIHGNVDEEAGLTATGFTIQDPVELLAESRIVVSLLLGIR